jgi:5'-nucleotidase
VQDRIILVTNDDGIEARGIRALEQALADWGRCFVVAPKAEQSASSHSLTLRSSIPVTEVDRDHFAVEGTPTDCVLLAIQGLMERPPDLLVSGINHGPNMGEDVSYSGTVAAAIEGTILGVPSVAISSLQRSMEDADAIARIARRVLETIWRHGLPRGTLLNVNIPDPAVAPIRGVRITKLGSRAYRNVIQREEAEGELRFRIGGEDPIWKDDNGTDIAAIRGGFVSITPLHLDLTDYPVMVDMQRWEFEL